MTNIADRSEPVAGWTTGCVAALQNMLDLPAAAAAQAAREHDQFISTVDRSDPASWQAYLATAAPRVLRPIRTMLNQLPDPGEQIQTVFRAETPGQQPPKAIRKWLQPLAEQVYRERADAILALELAAVQWVDAIHAAHAKPVALDRHCPSAAQEVYPRPEPDEPDDATQEVADTPPFPGDMFAEALRTVAGQTIEPVDPGPAPEGNEWAPADEPAEPWWRDEAREDLELRQETTNRLEIVTQLVGLQTILADHGNLVMETAWRRGVSAITDGMQAARTHLEHALPDLQQCFQTRSKRECRQALLVQLDGIVPALEKRISRMASAAVAVEATTLAGTGAWERLQTRLDDLPRALRVHIVSPDGDNVRDVEVDLHTTARDAIAPPWPQQLADEAEKLRLRLVQVGNELDQVLDIVRYNLEAAGEELEARGEDADEHPLQAARELALDGVRRAADRLDEIRRSIAPEWHALSDALDEAILDDWGAVHRRMQVRAQVSEKLVGLQTRSQRTWETFQFNLKEWSKKAGGSITKFWTVTSRWFMRLVRRGQSAVGVAAPPPPDAWPSLAPLRNIADVQASLPRVYRRLFTLSPLEEKTLVVGLSRPLVELRRHAERWTEGVEIGPAAIIGAPGAGRTTMLHQVARSSLKDVPTCQWSATRPADANAFARAAAGEMKLDGVTDAESFRRAVADRDRVACLVDNAEHLILQRLGYGETTQAVLNLMVATGRNVLWVMALSDGAWHFLERARPHTAGGIEPFRLPTYGTDEIEELIIHRHEKSGVPLWFEEPAKSSTLLRQRIRRAQSEEKKQAILRRGFFEALRDSCGGNPGLAIAQWIRACDFEHRANTLTLRVVPTIDMSFLKALPIEQQFALRALLIHGTLSSGELADVLRVSAPSGLAILKSLLADGLAVPTEETDAPERRARLLPLARQPVADFLRQRHLVYW